MRSMERQRLKGIIFTQGKFPQMCPEVPNKFTGIDEDSMNSL